MPASHQKSSLPMSVCISARRGEPSRRLPVGAAREREEALLVEILLEHVEPFGEQRDRVVAVRRASRASSASAACCAARRSPAPAPPARASDRREGMPISNSAVDRFGAAGDAERAEAGRGAAQQFLEAGVLVGELQRLDQIALVRLAVDAEQADRGRDRRLRLAAAPCAGAPPASRARACRRSFPAPAPHRPAAGHRAWRRRSARRSAYCAL